MTIEAIDKLAIEYNSLECANHVIIRLLAEIAKDIKELLDRTPGD